MSDAPSLSPLQRAFLALEETRAKLRAAESAAREPIAIVGLGCRVPGDGNDAESFWRLLRDGVDATGPLPRDRWDVDALHHPDPDHPGTIATRAGGFLRSVDTFDPTFFGITRREAQGMDPQQRLLLETCWEALEHAGQAPDRLERSRTGVYVGVASSDYAYLQLESRDRTLLDAHFASGIAHSVASGRLSYLLGLQGPSLTVDTACSSSLVAVHLACQALRAGDCRLALAGGVNLILSPDLYVALSRARMLSPDGRCKTFDAAADGFARGEGSAVVVLKRLADAEADGDRVLAVIRGSAVNQDGPSSGLTAPNGPAQETVIREALSRAGVAPRLVSYVEAHGTGTELGDPLELRALGAVFAEGRATPLLVGSVKTNVGHLEAAAGAAGLIKLVLALRHREIPPHLHLDTPTPHVAWDELALRVPTRRTPWEPIEGRRLAGVSSFGFSGTNAHVVVEEAPARERRPNEARRRVFVLSGVDEASLRAVAGRYAQALGPSHDLADVCYTAAVGRAHHAHRAAILAGSTAELRERLAALAAGVETEGMRMARVTGRDPARVAFLFTGQGAQHAGMGRGLYEREPVFRAAIDRCAAVLDPVLRRPLVEFLDSSVIDETAFTQPALFALEYALTALWQSWGIAPDAVIGHSVGEYAAACAAGVMSLDDALRLVAERGRLMQALPAGGAMAAVLAPEAEVAAALGGRPAVSIAAVNAPAQTVISGAAADIDALCAEFAARGVRCRRLPVSHAFHSPLVEPALDAFERAVAGVRLSAPGLPLVSNVTGRVADAAELTRPGYWRRHVRDAVRFADGLRALAALKPDVCVEIGPRPTLLAFAEETLGGGAALVPSLRQSTPDREQLDEALGALYLAGASIDWRAVWSAAPGSLVDLPTYPFQRERCWFTPRRVAPARGRETGHPLLGARLHGALRDIVQFEQTVRADDLAFLRDHVVRRRAILPGAAFVEMALAAARSTTGGGALGDVVIAEPLAFGDDETRRVQTVVRTRDDGSSTFEILSAPADDDETPWVLHAKGALSSLPAAPATTPAPTAGLTRISAAEHRAGLAARGLVFGPSLHGVRHVDARDGEALGTIALPDAALDDAERYVLPPALLDACLQVLSAAIPRGAARDVAYLPLHVESVRAYRTPGRRVTARATVEAPARPPADTLTGAVVISDEQGVVAELTGITLRAASGAADVADDLYTVAWEPLDDDGAWTPPVATLAAECGPSLDALAREHGLAEYHAGFVALEALVPRWIVRALRALGWRDAVGEAVRADALVESLGIVPRHRRLVGRLLDVLTDAGVLRERVVARSIDVGDPSADAAALIAAHPSSRARAELARRCGDALADVLRGAADPLQLLFPGGSTELATSLYRDTPEARAYNALVRDAVRSLARHRPAGRALRVLEVGGGTGGTTAWVAPALDGTGAEYLFTDVGASLVAAARERFGARHPFMAFETLDLERDPAEQSSGGRQFDVILASNVVHATADLRATLARLRGLLAPGGTLLMLEVAGRERWIDVTFGLTEGWWRFADADLRPDYPLLARSEWLALLAASGFEAGEIGGEHPLSREALLAARKPAATLPDASGRWVVLADAGGVGASLALRLERAGRRVTIVSDGSLGDVADVAGIVHLRSLDVAVPDDQERALGSLLDVVQTLGRASFATPPRLWIATRGAQPVDGVVSGLAQAPILGMALGIAREHPELGTTRVDLDPASSVDAQADSLLALLGRDAAEDQIAVRDGVRYVPRLTRSDATGAAPAERLERPASGVLEDLAVAAATRTPPAAGQVEIEVRAAGLNFRDVMNAVAMRADPEPLGGECAGRVVAVGAGVTDFAVGDDVVAIAEGCFATYALADAAHVARLPRVSFAEAATVPFAFMTARFALHECARLGREDTVLIHAAAGGVGQAAVRIAQAAGARVIATAGSEAKRALLRAQGVEHVLDSRTLAFEREALALTGGRGVDVVLNSLAGDVITASVGCLAPDGRFCEIGKRDVWTAEEFAEVRPDARYFAIDLAALRRRDPARSAALFRDVIADLDAGRIRPLPRRAFPLRRAADAFRFMAQARHVGKVVLVPDGASLDRLSPAASYLVTGGLTGIGLLTAERLAERGARRLVLAGRRAPDDAARATIERLRAAGVEVRVVAIDVGDADAVGRLLATIPRLRGVVHSAGALDDGALLQQTWPRFATPLRAKVDGAWALHALTADRPLDFFVLYSSVASVLGSAGQANHSAANAFLDALAHHRRALGLPALSVSWGAWSDVGAAAERGADRRVGALGIGAITPARGLALLDAAARGGAAHVVAAPIDWERFGRDAASGRRFFDRVARRATTRHAETPAPDTPGTVDVDALRGASAAHRRTALLAFVSEHVARVVGAPSARAIAVDQPLNELGLDSLMAVDLRNRLGRALGLPRGLPATLVFDHPTLDALTRYLDTLVAPAPAAAPSASKAPLDIDELSEDEIEALFANRMEAR